LIPSCNSRAALFPRQLGLKSAALAASDSPQPTCHSETRRLSYARKASARNLLCSCFCRLVSIYRKPVACKSFSGKFVDQHTSSFSVSQRTYPLGVGRRRNSSRRSRWRSGIKAKEFPPTRWASQHLPNPALESRECANASGNWEDGSTSVQRKRHRSDRFATFAECKGPTRSWARRRFLIAAHLLRLSLSCIFSVRTCTTYATNCSLACKAVFVRQNAIFQLTFPQLHRYWRLANKSPWPCCLAFSQNSLRLKSGA